MANVVRPSLPSARTVERFLAALLVGLLGAYALGAAAEDAVPVLRAFGVVSVHLAVVVAAVFPTVVVGHALADRVRGRPVRSRALEVGAAVGSLACLVGGLAAETAPATAQFALPLLGAGVGGLLVLAGLVTAGR